MQIVIRDLHGPDLSRDFLETLASMSEVGLGPAETLAVFRERLRAGFRTYVAILGERVVGTATLFVEHKFIHRGGRVGHIEDVAVHRDFQKQGVGAALVKHATEQARQLGCYKAVLYCSENTVPFYVKLGYHEHDVGMRIDF